MAMPALAYATADAMHAWWDAIMAAMQAWDTPLPVLLVMAAGITAGSVIKSITGFGSTIAHLCIWSAARAVGIPSGTLQQAVVTEVIFRTVTAVPYLHMTDARRTANLKLVVSVSLFQTLGSPLGAWLLVVLDQRSLELSLAAALVAVLLVQWASWLLFPQPQSQPQPQAGGLPSQATSSSLKGADWVDGGEGDLAAPLLQGSGDGDGGGDSGDCVVVVAGGNVSAKQGDGDDDASTAYAAAGARQELQGSWEEAASQASKAKAKTGSGAGAGAAPSSSAPSPSSPALQDSGGLRTWLVLLAAGSVAGTLSGVMGGLTGIDGPPTIFMFTWLHADKAVVRGTNAVINCLLMAVLLIAYAVQGIFAWRDMPLYLVGSACGWVGTVWGNRISGLMSQLAFQRLLNAMVVLCAGFMLVSALVE